MLAETKKELPILLALDEKFILILEIKINGGIRA